MKSKIHKNRLYIPCLYQLVYFNLLLSVLGMAKTEQKQEEVEYHIELGQHIRKLRKSKGMSIEEIAYKAGIDAQNLRKYELGKQEMRVSMLKRLADAFEMSVSELVNF